MDVPAIDLFIVAAYVISVVGFGIWKSRHVKTSSEFLLAGRSLGIVVLLGALVMCEFNTATMLGYASFGYMAGNYAMYVIGSMLIGLTAYTFIVAARWKKIDTTSMVEMFEMRFNKQFRTLVTVLVVFLLIFFSPAYLRAAGIIFAPSLGLSLPATVILISSVVLLFSIVGGLTSVAFTNSFSFLLTFIALPAMWLFSRKRALEIGSLETVFDARYLSFSPEGMWDDKILPFSFIFSLYVLLFLIYMQNPWYAQYMFAAKNKKTAFLTVMVATVIILGFYALAMNTATYSKIGFPDLDDPQRGLALAIKHWMPAGIRGLALAAVFGICQTTMASIWNNCVSIITNDIYKRLNPEAGEKKLVTFSRIITFTLAMFTIVISLTLIDQVINALYVANILLASLFFPAVGGLLWWRTGLKAIWITTILSIVAGFAIFFIYDKVTPSGFNAWMLPYYGIICPSIVLLGVLISFLEKPNDKFLERRLAFFHRAGAPVFGRRAYLRYKLQKENGV